LVAELQRFPSLPALEKKLEEAGFRGVRSRFLKGVPGYLSREQYAEWIATKPISTFELISDEEFAGGLQRFKAAPDAGMIEQFFVYHSCFMVSGSKPHAPLGRE